MVRQIHEVLQQLQADFLAFLRVKLRGENVVAPHCTDAATNASAMSRWLSSLEMNFRNMPSQRDPVNHQEISFRNGGDDFPIQ